MLTFFCKIINAPKKTDENLTEDEKAERSVSKLSEVCKNVDFFGQVENVSNSCIRHYCLNRHASASK